MYIRALESSPAVMAQHNKNQKARAKERREATKSGNVKQTLRDKLMAKGLVKPDNLSI